MSLKFTVPLAVATASLLFTGVAQAQTYTETGDAGDLPATAQVITGVVGVTYTSITGSTTASVTGVPGSGTPVYDPLYDSDMYQITIATPETFTASTTAFVSGANNFDTQLALFNSSGVGVVANDDAATGGDQSTFSTGSTLLLPGTYYLLISGSGRYAVDSTGALIFPNYTDGTTDPSATVAATSTLPVTAYTGNSNEGGNYVISLTVVPSVAVPEPGAYVCILTGLAGLTVVTKLRRNGAK